MSRTDLFTRLWLGSLRRNLLITNEAWEKATKELDRALDPYPPLEGELPALSASGPVTLDLLSAAGEQLREANEERNRGCHARAAELVKAARKTLNAIWDRIEHDGAMIDFAFEVLSQCWNGLQTVMARLVAQYGTLGR